MELHDILERSAWFGALGKGGLLADKGGRVYLDQVAQQVIVVYCTMAQGLPSSSPFEASLFNVRNGCGRKLPFCKAASEYQQIPADESRETLLPDF